MGFMKDLLIISAGKFGREIYGWASQAIAQGAPWKIKGFLDDRPYALDGFDYPVGILGTVTGYWPEAKNLFIGAVGDPHDKIKSLHTTLETRCCFYQLDSSSQHCWTECHAGPRRDSSTLQHADLGCESW